MSYRCPVCRHNIPLSCIFFTTVRGNFQCTGCDSQIGVNPFRRLLVLPIWLVLLYIATRYIRLPASYDLLSVLVTFIPMYILYFVWFEKPRIVQRCGFHCKDCGYDLQGQVDPRCPECGRVFDDIEIARMKKLVKLETEKIPQRKSASLIIILILLIVFTILAVIGVRVYNSQTNQQKTPLTTPSVTAPTAP